MGDEVQHNILNEFKKTVRMILSVLLSVILSVQVTVSVFAAEGEREVEPRLTTSNYLRVDLMTQKNSNWCWAACSASLITYITDSWVIQDEVYVKLFNAGTNNPASITDVKEMLLDDYNIISLYAEPRDSNNPAEASRIMELYQIKTEIDNNRPILTRCITPNAAVGHCRLICGYTYNDINNTGTVRYMEPFYGTYVDKDYSMFVYTNSNEFWSHALYSVQEALLPGV